MLWLIMIALYVVLTHDRGSGGGFFPGSRQPRVYTYSRVGRHTYVRW